MALITPERLVILKEKVTAECKRRKYTGSVAKYSATAYNFSIAPTKGQIILKEHYEKIAEPLNAITGDIDTNGARIISDAELAVMETKVDKLAAIKSNASQANTGCAASCTGLCSTDCVSGCTGCGSGCSGDCWGSCDNTCKNTCEGTCVIGCNWTCEGSDCGNNCYHECAEDMCTSVCSWSCTNSCNGELQSSTYTADSACAGTTASLDI